MAVCFLNVHKSTNFFLIKKVILPGQCNSDAYNRKLFQFFEIMLNYFLKIKFYIAYCFDILLISP